MTVFSPQAAQPPPVGSGIFTLVAVATIFCFVLLLLRHYLPLRTTPAYLIVPVSLALALPASVILLVPIDLTSSTSESPRSGIWLPDRVMLVSWRIAYWLTFVLTWAILPLLGEFADAGYRTPKDRITYSLRSNARYQLFVLCCATIGLVYVLFQNGFKFNSLKSVVMALAYMWGLVLAIYLMGHGLVAIPRKLWRNANPSNRLRRLQSRAPLIYDRLIDAKSNLEDIRSQVIQLERRKATIAPDLQDWLDDLVDEVNSPAIRAAQHTEGEQPRVTIPAVITERYLAELTRNLNRARHKNARFTDTWGRLVLEAADCQAVMDSSTSKRLEFNWRTAATPPRFYRRPLLTPYLRYLFHSHVLPTVRFTLSGFFALASACIIWSELVKSFAPSISIVNLSVTHTYHGTAVVGFTGQLIASAWILYMCSAAFAGITDTKVWGNRALVPRNTYGESACWYAGLVARLTVPLAYNFITLLSRDVQHKTTFYDFLGQLIDLTPLGKGFDYFFPIFILVPVGATLFNMYGKVRNALGFGLLDSDDNDDDDNAGIGVGTWREGRELINQELSGPEFLGLSSRSAAGGTHFRDADPVSPATPRRAPTIRVPHSQTSSLPRYEHPAANRTIDLDDEEDETPFQLFVHRVKNTFETTGKPKWLQRVDSELRRPRWMRDQDDVGPDADGGVHGSSSGLNRFFGV
ncbi:hypothetical protein LOZ53_005402 [Ophidiomyces ophidiicola]|nr:hypothetical protein LOZ55_006526 [Ophidiomyces ophidiicola]KAI1982827.1 hypothetical protein LOZ54_005236 [Ophidiomyces ophidiicola]KAI1984592.1 hypothetical protein LOZ53_005402 [Ophidiomyces ophidiicola]KAI1998118.1 hypothetical protein LOZ51_002795 [Ophidiomyces ophidiicola]